MLPNLSTASTPLIPTTVSTTTVSTTTVSTTTVSTTTVSTTTVSKTTSFIGRASNSRLPQLISPSRQDMESASLPAPAAQSNLLLQLPQELIFKVLTDLPVRFTDRHPLRAFATTARQPSQLFRQFLESEAGKPYMATFEAGPVQAWTRCAQKLLKDASSLRQALVDSAEQIRAGADPVSMTGFGGIGVDFKLAAPTADLQAQLFQLCDTPIKLMAGGIGRERFLNEVLPVLAGVDYSCSVILDASHNDLDTEALSALEVRIRFKRNVYSIDLSHNPLVEGEAVCQPLVQLLSVSPLTHLLLADTHCNDATALALATPLEKHGFLRQLDLRGNSIGVKGTLALVNAVQRQCEAVRPGAVRALRLKGNPASLSCVDGLAYAVYRHKRFGVMAGQKAASEWRGYALLGDCKDLLKAIDRLNGRGAMRTGHASPVVTIGATNDGEDDADEKADALKL